MNKLCSVGIFFLFILLTACDDSRVIEVVTGLPDAENSVVTRDGQLFISAYNGVYEIIQSGSAYTKSGIYLSDQDPVWDWQANAWVVLGKGFFLGMAEYNNAVYLLFMTESFQSYLIAFDCDSGFTQIAHRFKNVTMLNGMDVDEQGRLYVVDQISISLKLGRIIRVHVDQALRRVISDADVVVWADKGINLPNGILYFNNSIFFTDMWRVKRIPILSNGGPGKAITIYNRPVTVFDDLGVYGDNLLVTDFLKGTVFELSMKGEVIQELPSASICGPSSIEFGYKTKGLFPDDAVIVTSKGVPYEYWSGMGNSLVYFNMP